MAHKLPLFAQSLLSYKCSSSQQTEVQCGTSYTLLVPTPTRTQRPVTYAWTAATAGHSSHLRVYSANTTQLKELGTVTLSSCTARAIVFVPVATSSVPGCEEPLRVDMVSLLTT